MRIDRLRLGCRSEGDGGLVELILERPLVVVASASWRRRGPRVVTADDAVVLRHGRR
jgi:hypothetical protein